MTAIRLAPSGPVIGNTDGGPLSFGPGARLRLTEANSVMGGSLALPTIPDVISPDGFGDPDAIVLTLLAPKAELKYRANLALDIQNISTNAGGECVLYLDMSIDGGATYVNVARNSHLVAAGVLGSAQPVSASRQCELWCPQLTGASLGVISNTTASVKLRARALAASANPNLLVNSPASSGGIEVQGLSGTIHMELEECF
jgi:hypothetical protein